MSKHTPGPWEAKCRHIGYVSGYWSEDEFLQWEVEGPRHPRGRGDYFQGDALLIAAAPELLEAAIRARDIAMEYAVKARIPECGKFSEIAQELDAAIAKATTTGETP